MLMYIGIGFTCALVFRYFLARENAARQRGDRDEIIENATAGVDEKGMKGHERNGRFATVEDAKREKGDEWSGYRYTL